jgi:hypothetical protein
MNKIIPLQLKYLTGLILSIIIYFALTLFYRPIVVSVLLKNDCRVRNINSNTPIDIDTLLYSIFIMLLFALIIYTKNNLKTDLYYFASILILILVSIIFQLKMIDYVSSFKIDESIVNEFPVNYQLLYRFPTIFLFPIFFKKGIILMNGKNIVNKYKYLSNVTSDISYARLIAMSIDMVIVLILAFFFSKVLVLYSYTAALVIVFFFYYFFTVEYSLDTSIGKMLMGLKVTSMNNKSPSVFRIFIRTLGRIIPFYAITILFKKNGLHDFISGTKVVKTEH